MRKMIAGYCIYCGEKNQPLSREHIIPYAMGGDQVLHAASCQAHALITSKAEEIVARNMYGVYRAENGMPSRNPKGQENLLNSSISLEGIDYLDRPTEVVVRRRDVPSMPIFPILQLPGILAGKSVGDTYDLTVECLPSRGLRELRERFNLKKIWGPTSNFDAVSFFRVLAKIGHAHACSIYRPEDYEPYLVPLILGNPEGAFHYVGGFETRIAQAPEELRVREELIAGKVTIVVEISLKKFPYLPRYQVASGYLRKLSQIN